MMYKVLVIIAGLLMRIVFRVKVSGADRIPSSGGAIICANHIHNLDPVLVAMFSERPIRFLAKAESFSWPVLGYFIKQVGAIPVRRGTSDIAAIRQSIALLKAGGVLGIFPEGTRSKLGEERQPFQGVAMLADTTSVPIVPVGISGTYRPWTKLYINIGEAVMIRDLDKGSDYDRERATRELMNRISILRGDVS